MLRFARFALLVGMSAAIPAIFALNPPQKQDQNKQEKEKKKVDAPKKDTSSEERLDRRNTRMKERNREIDSLVNKQKK
jgi:hypothetical protein